MPSFLNGQLSDSFRNIAIQCQFWLLLPFLAFNAVSGIPCRMWHLMHEMAWFCCFA
jgi:hypothetical protein